MRNTSSRRTLLRLDQKRSVGGGAIGGRGVYRGGSMVGVRSRGVDVAVRPAEVMGRGGLETGVV